MRGDAWLCVAHDHRSGEKRDFNLTRIRDVRPRWPESNGGDYRVPEEFDLELYFIDRFESLDAETVYEVRLLLEEEVVPYFESKSYHRTQQLHREDPELEESDLEEGSGRAVASFEVAGLEEIAAFVRSWGTGVKVLGPPELAERIAEEARAVAKRYR
jgi:predicted DNA-binding transcriptional regulator YafY